MPKLGYTYGRSGNLAETTLAKTKTGSKVILEAVLPLTEAVAKIWSSSKYQFSASSSTCTQV